MPTANRTILLATILSLVAGPFLRPAIPLPPSPFPSDGTLEQDTTVYHIAGDHRNSLYVDPVINYTDHHILTPGPIHRISVLAIAYPPRAEHVGVSRLRPSSIEDSFVPPPTSGLTFVAEECPNTNLTFQAAGTGHKSSPPSVPDSFESLAALLLVLFSSTWILFVSLWWDLLDLVLAELLSAVIEVVGYKVSLAFQWVRYVFHYRIL
jgi:hypothetical protein